jgi:hypothetical protein
MITTRPLIAFMQRDALKIFCMQPKAMVAGHWLQPKPLHA